MIRSILLTTCIFALSNAAPASDIEEIKVKFQELNDIESFLSENPNVELIPLEKKLSVKEGNRVQLQYTFGERKPGDRLYGDDSNKWAFPVPEDVLVEYRYDPRSPTEDLPNITYLIIDVEQSTDLGNAYIVYGGIGFKYVLVFVEAKKTTYLNARAQLFVID